MNINEYRCEFFLSLIMFLFFSMHVGASETVIQRAIKLSQNNDHEGFVVFINKQKKSGGKYDTYKFFNDIWFESYNSTEGLNLIFFKEPEIRLEIAEFLSQLHINHYFETDINSLHDFIRSSIQSKEYMVRLKSISGLGLFDDEFDVPLLINIMEKENSSTFRAAVYSLLSMCNKEALRAVNISINNLMQSENEEYVKSEIKQWSRHNIESRRCNKA